MNWEVMFWTVTGCWIVTIVLYFFQAWLTAQWKKAAEEWREAAKSWRRNYDRLDELWFQHMKDSMSE